MWIVINKSQIDIEFVDKIHEEGREDSKKNGPLCVRRGHALAQSARKR